MPRATPQPNWIENTIDIVTMMCGCTLAASNIPDNFKNILMPFAIKYAYHMCGLQIIKINNK